jgi:hypothetical protein
LIPHSINIGVSQWFYHYSSYGKIAINRDKVMRSLVFAIILNSYNAPKKFETGKFKLDDLTALSKNLYFGSKLLKID